MNRVSGAYSDGLSPLNSPHICRAAEPHTGFRGAPGGDPASRRPDIQKKPELGSLVDSGGDIGLVVEPGREGDVDQDPGCVRGVWLFGVDPGLEGSSWLDSEQTLLRLVEEDKEVVHLRLLHPEGDRFDVGGEGDVSGLLGSSVLIPIGLRTGYQNPAFAMGAILDDDRERGGLDAGEQVGAGFSKGTPGKERDEGQDRDRGQPAGLGSTPRASMAGIPLFALHHGRWNTRALLNVSTQEVAVVFCHLSGVAGRQKEGSRGQRPRFG